MATIDYVEVPACATRLRTNSMRPEPELKTPLPPQQSAQHLSSTASAGDASAQLSSPLATILPQLLLSSSIPSSAQTPASPNSSTSTEKLTSKRDPLSIPITTTNFRRFVARVGPVFWLQDRIEEIVLWRRGTRVTCTWLSAYAFLCYCPKLVLLLPHIILFSIILSSSPANIDGKEGNASPPPTYLAGEASSEWMANIQGIQNLMGVASDVHDLITPLIPHLTYRSPYTSRLLLGLFLSLPPLVLLLVFPCLPLRLLSFATVAVPILLLHPRVHSLGLRSLLGVHLPRLAMIAVCAADRFIRRFNPATRGLLIGLDVSNNHEVPAVAKNLDVLDARRRLVTLLTRFVDNDCLSDAAWSAELREVELFENERWVATPDSGVDASRSSEDGYSEVVVGGTWSKANLKSGERAAWTRGRDGWSAVGDKGYVSNLTFSLAPGWAFVETEGWRRDLLGLWVDGLVDENGWTYTNDAWMQPQSYRVSPFPNRATESDSAIQPAPAVTRRRRWVRRIYYRGQNV